MSLSATFKCFLNTVEQMKQDMFSYCSTNSIPTQFWAKVALFSVYSTYVDIQNKNLFTHRVLSIMPEVTADILCKLPSSSFKVTIGSAFVSFI